MADLSEVEQSFYGLVRDSMQMPMGYASYTVASSALLSIPLRVFRGWPLDQQLSDDLRAGVSNIGIFSNPGMSKNTSRFLRSMTTAVVSTPTATMTAVASGKTVTFAGTASINEVIGIGCVAFGYSYRLQVGDTPTSVAAIFAVNMPSATSVGAVLTIDTTHPVTVAYGADVTSLTELSRQVQLIRVSTWSPTTLKRDNICSALEPAILFQDRFVFAENSISGPITSVGTHVDDCVGLEGMWRRDLIFSIEYATNYKIIQPTYVLGETTGPAAVFI